MTSPNQFPFEPDAFGREPIEPETNTLPLPEAGSVDPSPEVTAEQSAPEVPAGAEAQIVFGEPPRLLFQQYLEPEVMEEPRIPHMGHVGILVLIALCALFAASLVARAGVEIHLFGVTTIAQAATEIHYTLGSEAIFYLLTFAGSLLIFPLLWHKSFFAGLQWNGKTALRLRGRLISAAILCFILAILNGMLIPGPSDAPIDRIFRIPGAAWMLFAFGVTLAPFFEELGFRGFLLPAFCTAFDWVAEKVTGAPPLFPDENGHPQWSRPAIGVASVLTSILFALMHGDQTGYAFGPFLLLICVSLVLCWARLGTRSLAASVLVHACYNFILFSFMFFGTSGFRHLERM